MALMLELLGDDFDFLAARGIGDQQGVRGVNDDQVVQAHGADQSAWRVDVAIADVMQHGLAIALVTLFVRFLELAYRLPAADVAPAQVGRQHGHLA
ncbi:hypothetical protein D3C77_606860 [compost metagenome]